MNRTKYFNYIEEKLNILAYRVESKGKLNILDLHIHSEGFYERLINSLFDWNLYNLNPFKQNIEAIDLIDDINKIVVQVSSTATKEKVEKSLNKKIIQQKGDHRFVFISISKDASELRKKTFINPYSIIFNPQTDIFDIQSILNFILTFVPLKQKEIYKIIQDELGNEVDIVKLDSNLATVINILSKEDWSKTESSNTIKDFEIERKISHNNLIKAKYIIEDYKIHYNRVNKKYKEYDEQGLNKSLTVLNSIRSEYIKNILLASDDELFFEVLDSLVTKVINSANYTEIPIDELELCVNILVVDAFIRCKIFENPDNYNYATS